MNDSDTVTVQQVAQRLGLHPNTVYNMLKNNSFPARPLPLPQRKILFSRTAIDRLVENNTTR